MTILTTPKVNLSAEDQRQFRAFVQDDQTRKIVDEVIGDLLLPSASVHKGGIREAIRQLGAQRSPKILVVDVTDADLPLSAINELAEVCEPGTTVIAIGDRNDVGLFRDLINNGISDYLVKPITSNLLRQSILAVIDSSLHIKPSYRLGRLITITGTRGGVGATILATNIAWTIANKRRRRVALVDLDLQYGTVALALDLEPSHGFRDALEHPSQIDSLFIDRTMTKHSDTLYVLSAEESLGDTLILDPAALDVLIKELRNKFHYVIIDLPRQVSPFTQTVLQTATNLLLVSDMSLAGMRDTLRQISTMSTLNASCQLTIVANRAGEYRTGEIGRQEFEAAIGRSIDYIIPFDSKTVAAANNAGQPIAAGHSNVAKVIQLITDKVSGINLAGRTHRFTLWPFGSR